MDKEKELLELEKQTMSNEFWSDTENTSKVLKRITDLKNKLNNFKKINSGLENLKDMNELLQQEPDEELVKELLNNTIYTEKEIDKLEITILLSGNYDMNNAIVTIHPGAGGTEAQDWAEMLYRMYSRWATDNGYEIKELDYLDGEELDSYIKELDSSDVNSIIKNLKEIKSENFTDGKVIKITGNIPLFKFDYQLKLKDDLKSLGITSVFNGKKADLSNMVTSKNYIDSAEHKANIEFSNEGIKAAAVTSTGGMGAASCGYEHLFDVPVEEVNITFDKPYLFLIRDKNSGEGYENVRKVYSVNIVYFSLGHGNKIGIMD